MEVSFVMIDDGDDEMMCLFREKTFTTHESFVRSPSPSHFFVLAHSHTCSFTHTHSLTHSQNRKMASHSRTTKALLLVVVVVVSLLAHESVAQNVGFGPWSGSQANSVSQSWQITAPAGYAVGIYFSVFNSESCCDFVRAYSGTSTANTQICKIF